ncbi:MAG: hypothetical protein JSV23_08920 [Promethearchaeota archaeon]|nr:MAG: hypothetical protein JSV23_08920 [Candidatus Lokiarchaeota archaeon]
MDLSSIYSELKELLSISDDKFNLERDINQHFNTEPDENKLEILGDILNFVNKFSIFKEIKPFMDSVYSCINKTLKIRPDSIFDFEELLIKNSIMHFIQEYISYSKITQKDQVFNFLVDSLEKLQLEPLVMNLGLLLKPLYQDQSHIKNLENLKEVEITYNSTNGTEIQIKNEIDNWFKTQNISLDNQDELRELLKQEFERLITKHNLTKESEKLKRLEIEVMEMLTMKLTMLSLVEHITDDSFEPIPIK